MHKLFAKVRRNQKGFTLIEMLVVIAIIGMLAAFAVPRLFEAMNTAKESQGKADLDTISSALERYYMRDHHYPTGTAATIQAALKPAYLKDSTSFHNGWDKGYILVVDTDGKGYMLLDPGNNTGSVAITCGGTSQNVTIGSSGLAVHSSGTTDPAACTFTPAGLHKVTN